MSQKLRENVKKKDQASPQRRRVYSAFLTIENVSPQANIHLRAHLSLCQSPKSIIRISLCVYRRISLTAEPIWFYFTMQLHTWPGSVYNYFGGGYHKRPKRISCLDFLLKLTLKMGVGRHWDHRRQYCNDVGVKTHQYHHKSCMKVIYNFTAD